MNMQLMASIYLKREVVTIAGKGVELFGSSEAVADGGAFAERCADDRHHFCFIVSPEAANPGQRQSLAGSSNSARTLAGSGASSRAKFPLLFRPNTCGHAWGGAKEWADSAAFILDTVSMPKSGCQRCSTRIHKTVRISPARAADVTDRL